MPVRGIPSRPGFDMSLEKMSDPTIGVIDYGMGNLGSVSKALIFLGFQAQVLTEPDQVLGYDRLVLPGVGAMTYAMQNLKRSGMDQAIRQYLATGRPFLGICLGMQLMFDRSEEGDAQGLGVLPGVVSRFRPQPGLKIPHMGWNRIARSSLALIPNDASYYFVHSYYVRPRDESLVVATCDHGGPFTAAVRSGPILLTQFHPEKSGDTGLALLDRWVTQPEQSRRAGGLASE